ncbi:MAG: integration host factor subunit beta [Candidatus Scalindua sp.]|nr:integration host factor subunit beta [Candidatus Scalindua sp.]MCR4344566.1 integration host factor subunit beta [Candidatus Scalindua sp.]
MATITKRELAEAISQKLGSPQIITKQTIQLFLELCTEELAKGNRLEFRDFGILTTVERGPRIGRNPKTGTTVDVPPKRVVRFKSGRLLKEKVQDDSSQDASTDTNSDISTQGQ